MPCPSTHCGSPPLPPPPLAAHATCGSRASKPCASIPMPICTSRWRCWRRRWTAWRRRASGSGRGRAPSWWVGGRVGGRGGGGGGGRSGGTAQCALHGQRRGRGGVALTKCDDGHGTAHSAAWQRHHALTHPSAGVPNCLPCVQGRASHALWQAWALMEQRQGTRAWCGRCTDAASSPGEGAPQAGGAQSAVKSASAAGWCAQSVATSESGFLDGLCNSGGRCCAARLTHTRLGLA